MWRAIPMRFGDRSARQSPGATASAVASQHRWPPCALPNSQGCSRLDMATRSPTTMPAAMTPSSFATTLRGERAIRSTESSHGSSSARRGYRRTNAPISPVGLPRTHCAGGPTRLRTGCGSLPMSEPGWASRQSAPSIRPRLSAPNVDALRNNTPRKRSGVQTGQFPVGNIWLPQRNTNNPGKRWGSVAAPGIAAVAQVRPQHNGTLYWGRTCAKGARV